MRFRRNLMGAAALAVSLGLLTVACGSAMLEPVGLDTDQCRPSRERFSYFFTGKSYRPLFRRPDDPT